MNGIGFHLYKCNLSMTVLILVCISLILLSNQEEFYIIPSSSDACSEGKQCLTLPQFISQSSHITDLYSVTLYFQPGNHTLFSRLRFESNLVVMAKNYSDSDYSVQCVIKCINNGSVVFVHTILATVYNVEFRSCQLQLFENANVNIINSSFLFGFHGKLQRAYLDHRYGRHNWGYGKPGVILSERSNISLSDCTFESNKAQLGAALFVTESVIEIYNSSFIDNGVVCTRRNMMCSGGVVYSYNSTITIDYSNFHNNSAEHLVFHSSQGGGGVFALFESSASIHYSHFTSNSATHGSGGVIYGERINLSIIASFFYNNKAARHGGVIQLKGGMVTDSNSYYEGNTADSYGGVVFLAQGTLIFIQSKLLFNSAKSIGGAISVYNIMGTLFFYECEISGNSAKQGGAVHVRESYNTNSKNGIVHIRHSETIIIDHCTFTNNSASMNTGGVIYSLSGETMHIESCIFSYNSAIVGGVIHTANQKMTLIKSCTFSDNSASIGGVIRASGCNTFLIENCDFFNNSASKMGGVLRVTGLTNAIDDFTILNSVFASNFAVWGGVVHASNRVHMYMQDVTMSKNVADLGIMYLESANTIIGCSKFSTNIGSLFAYNSNVTIAGDITFTDSHSSKDANHTIYSEGGAITAFQSEIVLHGLCKFEKNFAASGGAIWASESQVYITGNTTMCNNTAEKNGGGVFLYQSELKCQGNSNLSLLENVAGDKGGAIHAISSSIKTTLIIVGQKGFVTRSKINFIENCADKGGAVSLEVNAKLYIFIKKVKLKKRALITTLLTFTRNKANYGGGIYIADDTNSGTCASTSFHILSSSTECFLQILHFQIHVGGNDNVATRYTYVNFINNIGIVSGAALYGGLLDRCTVSPFAEVNSVSHKSKLSRENSIIDGMEYFKVHSNIKLSSISSEPVRICFCNENDHQDCDYQPPPLLRKKGERFEIVLAAVDQTGSPLGLVNVLSSLSSNLGGLGVNQSNQTTSEGCTTFHYEVFSPHAVELLNLHAEGPCKDASLSQRKVLINFTTCECPIGFQPKVSDKTNCVCECDSKLDKYIKSCDFKTVSIIRKGNPWISYVTNSDNLSSGYLIYPHCPLDYCYPPGSNILVNINKPNGSDALCQHKRSGLLCGACRSELSLSVGTIHCISCPHYWPALLILQFMGSLVAGVVLITAVLMLNLTVAFGTLNGIIFYANILYNFIPSFISHSRITFSSVFVSWLNLELGFDSCFFKGMDTYSKTWVELLFPTYIIFLVITIILVSEWSDKFSHLIGKRNPVATLATLILFSYTKLLNIIIKALSFAIINYPGLQGPTKTVRWLPDASVEFFRGKHILLGIGAIILLFLCATFTGLVFFWQWLAYLDDNKIVKLVKTQKMSHFFEIYHAPYSPRNRYWTGLLLIIRIVLYVASSINVSGNPNVNLLIIGLIVSGVLLLKEFSGINSRIYKKWPIEILEVSIHINIIVLCVSTLFTNVIENEKAKEAIVNTSVAIVFLQLLGIILYHFFTELWKACFGGSSRVRQFQEGMELPALAPSTSVVERPNSPASQLMRADTTLREPLLEHTT